MYFKRQIERVLSQGAKSFRVVALTGARQTGKSTLLKKLFRNSHSYVTLDNPRELRLAQEDPELFFDTHKGPLIIDEIQYAPKLLSYIKIRVDELNKKGAFILTGSQHFTLMKGLRETLAGRVGLYHLYPMSILEGPESSRTYSDRALKGSYPEILTSKFKNTTAWYGSYLSTYIEKDILALQRIDHPQIFRDFIFLLAARSSQILNLSSLSNDLGVSVPTIREWVKILEASSIIYLLKPYYINLGSRLIKSPKVYFTDIGLVSYLTGVRDQYAILRGNQAGPLFENFVIQELLKSFSNRGMPPPLYYYRTNNNLEIDVLVETKQGCVVPLEMKLTKSPHPGMINSIQRLRDLNKGKIEIKRGALVSLVDQAFPLSQTETALPLTSFVRGLEKEAS